MFCHAALFMNCTTVTLTTEERAAVYRTNRRIGHFGKNSLTNSVKYIDSYAMLQL